MITEKELNPWELILTPIQKEFFYYHYYAVNEFRNKYSSPMIVSSGIRTNEDQVRIYKHRNERRIKEGLPPIPAPMNSPHILGAATDFFDYSKKIYKFATENEDLLKELGLYLEHGDYTPTWIHIQSVSPKSGTRFFIPY